MVVARAPLHGESKARPKRLGGAHRLIVEGAAHEPATGDSVFLRADVPHVYENRTVREIRRLDVIRHARGAGLTERRHRCRGRDEQGWRALLKYRPPRPTPARIAYARAASKRRFWLPGTLEADTHPKCVDTIEVD